MKVIADSGPLIAAVDSRERTHLFARALVERFGRDLLVPDVIVAEVDHLLRGRVSHDAARAFLLDVEEGLFTRVPLDRRAFARAVAYDDRYADLHLGIADASVMALAERERAPILTFDFRDFRAAPPLRGGNWRLIVDENRLPET